MRIGEIDRAETIESEYEPTLSEDGLSLGLNTIVSDPPKVFEGWDAEGVKRRAQWLVQKFLLDQFAFTTDQPVSGLAQHHFEPIFSPSNSSHDFVYPE
jgi:hypothetical protein